MQVMTFKEFSTITGLDESVSPPGYGKKIRMKIQRLRQRQSQTQSATETQAQTQTHKQTQAQAQAQAQTRTESRSATGMIRPLYAGTHLTLVLDLGIIS